MLHVIIIYIYAIYHYKEAASILLTKTLIFNVLLEKILIIDLFFKMETK